jgi:hypothetical protein
MSNSEFKVEVFDRLIAHEIYPKTEETEAYATYAKNFLVFNNDEKLILIDRLETAINNSNKTFQLEYEDRSEKSIFTFLHNATKPSEEAFFKYSQKLADELAASHFRTKIPGGFCLIGTGTTKTKKDFFFVVKAELQEVFSIENNELKLIKDVFLSPAKDFYKIGLFVKLNSSYVPYMYDDQFSLQKKDLTEYFYGRFLGLTTDKNDTLKSKNYFEETKTFIESNVDNMPDRLGLLKALHVLYREDTSGIISPKEFSTTYFEGQLKNKYDALIEKKYPRPFTKDTALIENRIDLQRISIPLTYAISLVGSSSSLENLEVISNPSLSELTKLEPEINNGMIRKIVLVRQERMEAGAR